MFITGLELFHFQKHKHLKLSFVDGVNVICGESDAGKSCIIRSLRWVYYNDIKGKAIHMNGDDKLETKVIVTYSDGSWISKMKSSSVNAYEVSTPGCDTVRFDSVGVTVPDKVRELTQCFPADFDEKLIVNISTQLEPHFLLDKSPNFRAKVFNKITGVDLFDQVAQSYNKDIVDCRKQLKASNTSLDNYTLQYTETKKMHDALALQRDAAKVLVHELSGKHMLYKKVVELREKIHNLQNERTSIHTEFQRYELLVVAVDAIVMTLNEKYKHVEKIDKAYKRNLLAFKSWLDCTDQVQVLPDYDDLQMTIFNLKNQCEGLVSVVKLADVIHSSSVYIKGWKEALNNIKIPDLGINNWSFIDKIERVITLQDLIKRRTEVQVERDHDIQMLDIHLITLNGTYKEHLKAMKQCPTCHGNVDEKRLEEITL